MAQRLANRLTLSPHYASIMEKYRAEFQKSGRVALKTFHEENIKPILPGFSYVSFCQFMRRAQIDAEQKSEGIEAPLPTVGPGAATPALPVGTTDPVVAHTAKIAEMMANMNANTKKGLALMIGIGLSALEEIAKDPSQLSARDRGLLLAAAMKAQDSRVGAIAKVKQEARDEAAFNRALNTAIYDEVAEEIVAQTS